MTPRVRVVIVGVLLTAAAAGCGQQGPLVLPESARPLERVDSPPGATDQPDEEQRDER